jgi:hypothetical protein
MSQNDLVQCFQIKIGHGKFFKHVILPASQIFIKMDTSTSEAIPWQGRGRFNGAHLDMTP